MSKHCSGLESTGQKTIPWIGCGSSEKYYLRELTKSGYNIISIRDAFSGISLLSVNNYSGVIVTHFIDAWNELVIPHQLEGNPIGQTCYFLGLIRKLPLYEKTPLMVTHLDENGEVQKQLINAGADKLVDMCSTPTTKFSGVLREFFK